MPGNNILGVRVAPGEAAYFQISSTMGSWPWVLPVPQQGCGEKQNQTPVERQLPALADSGIPVHATQGQ